MCSLIVIIPNWNGQHLLARCLESLAVQTYRDFVVIVVDNHSTDGSVAWLRAVHPDVQVIVNAENRGFATAINQGIRATHSRYLVTLNNDTAPAPDWLAALVAAVESDGAIGMVASKMLFADRPQMINSAGIAIDRVGIAWDWRGGEPDDPDERALVEIFGPCAGAALYRRAMLDEIGLFDEDFFAYMEDVDLAWRARAAGWRCLYAPQARVLHHHSATGKEGSPFKSFHLGRNKLWLLAKNYPVRELWHHVPLVWLYEGFALLYALCFRRDIHAWRGRWAGLRGWRAMWCKRPRVRPGVGRADIPFLMPALWPWQVSRRYQHLHK